MKKLAFCCVLLWLSLSACGQFNPGQTTPSKTAPTSPVDDPVGADVNLFTGTLNLSYDFGKVATLSGLSFPIRLNYTGNSVTAYEAEHSSGIPYGEGWSLSDASITVETRAWDFLSNELPTDTNQRPYYTVDQSREKGRTFWTNARLSLPGGISGRLVYKYPKEGTNSASVYVLHAFETYVEATFNGNKWEVLLPDGTVYVFAIRQFSHRNPTQTTAQLANNFAETILPGAEVARWHLSEIYNPNHALGQKILFEYDLFGEFDHIEELRQSGARDTIVSYRPVIGQTVCTQAMLDCNASLNGNYQVGDTIPLYANPIGHLAPVYTDVFLKSVTAIDALGQESSRAELVYHSFRPEEQLPPSALGKGKFLLLSDPQVRRQDSLYSRKVVWFQGRDDALGQILMDRPALPGNVPFDGNWKRYQHPMAHENPLSVYQPHITNHNPYIARYANLPFNVFSGYNPSAEYWARRGAHANPTHPNLEIPFTHSVLETPRFDGAVLRELPPGDLYELRAQVELPSELINADINFDVRVATGMDFDFLPFYNLGTTPVKTFSLNGTDYEFFPASINGPSGYFDQGYELFSTRRNIVKWNPAYQGQALRLTTSNRFKLQNIPNEFGGFVVQIGPAADNLINSLPSQTEASYFHRFSNIGGPAIPPSDSLELNIGSWFGTGAPLEPLFRTDRFGVERMNLDYGKGENGDRHLYWHLDPTLNFNDYQLSQSGPNQPTAVTREKVANPLSGTSFALYDGTMAGGHDQPLDTKLRSIEIERIAKNPYMLDSVIFYIMNGPLDNEGRVPIKAFKLDYEVAQVPVLNNINPAWPQAAQAPKYRTINSDTLLRNLFQLSAVERLPVDTIGRITAPTNWTGTQFVYHSDDPTTVEVNEAFLIKTVYNELGGKTDFLYDVASAESRRLNENVLRLSNDQSHEVIGKGDASEIRVPVKARIVQDGQGGRRTDYSFFQPVFLKRGIEMDSHFGSGYNVISKSDFVWGYGKAVVYEPQLNAWSGRARTEQYFHTATNSFSDSLLFGRLKESRSFDAQGQLRGKTEIKERVQFAYPNGLRFHRPASFLDNGLLVESQQNRIHSYELDFEVLDKKMDSYHIQRELVVTQDRDPQTGNVITGRRTWGYYDWDENRDDVGGEYAEMYRQVDPLATPPHKIFIYYDTAANVFRYGQEPSWQVAWERSESDDLPDSYNEVRHYYLWDIEPFLKGFGTLAGRYAGSFRPFHLAKEYGMRNVPYEKRTETWNGDPGEAPLGLSEYYHWETFRDVPGDFVQHVDSTNYGSLCDPGDGGFQRGMQHAVMYCFGEGEPVNRERMVNEVVDDPRYVEDQNGNWWHFPIEGYSTMAHASFNSMPSGLSPSPDERCDGGFVLGPDSEIKYFGEFALPSGTMASADVKSCDRFYGCETDSAKSRDRVSLIASLPHFHTDSICDKVHGFSSIQAANDSLVDSIPDGARQLFIDMLSPHFFLRATYQQADTIPNEYLSTQLHNPDFHSPHMLWDTVSGAPDYQGTSYRWIFKPPYPTIRTYKVHERNMHGLVVDESDARHLHTVYEYAHGSYEYWFDECGTAHSSLWRENYGLPLSVTVTDFEAIEHSTHFQWHPTGKLKGQTAPNGEREKYVYDERGRTISYLLNGIKRSSFAYGVWGGDLTDTWARRTQLNYTETTVHRDNLLPRQKVRTYTDPNGRIVQGIAGEYTALGWTKTFTGKQGTDAWGRVIWSERPQVKYVQSGMDYDPNLPTTVRSEMVYEDAKSSRVLKSAKFGNAINGPHVTENGYEIITLADFAFETGATQAEIAELFPFYDGTGGLPKLNLYRSFSVDEDKRRGASYTDAAGRLLATLDYDGTSSDERVLTLYVNDAGGRLVKIIDPEKKATTSKYNVLGWAYETTSPDAGKTVMQYNQAGDLRVVQDENRRNEGRYLITGYDRLGRVLEEYTDEIPSRTIGANVFLDSLYHSSSNIYSFSSILTIIDELGLEASDENHDLSLFNAVNSQFSFPGLTFYKSSPENLSKHRYDHDLDTAFASLPQPPQGSVHPNAQAMLNQQEKLTGRASFSMAYDRGTLVQLSWMNYDEEGNLSWLMRQFNPRGITPTDRGRVDLVRYPEHDLQGAVKRVVVDLRADQNPDFSQAYEYDGWGRLGKLYVNVGGADHLTADYQYDDATGQLKKTRYYANGAGSPMPLLADSITYSRDQRDRLTGFGSKYLDFSLLYDAAVPANVRAQENFSGLPNGIKAQYKVVGTGAQNRFKHATAYGYEYDGLGRLIRADAHVKPVLGFGGGTTFPDSQPLGDALAAPLPKWQGDAKYAYDKAGNLRGLWRYHHADPGTPASGSFGDSWTYHYTNGTNKLSTLKTGGNTQAALAYDHGGNLVSDTRRVLSGMLWDANNRNLGYDKGGDVLRHVYGNSGGRMYKEKSGASGLARTYYFNGPGGTSLAIWNDSTWSFPIYGNGMIGEWAKPNPDSSLARKAGNEPPQTPKTKGRGKKILRTVRNVALSLFTGAAIARQDREERVFNPIALAPAVAVLADELIDAKQGDGDDPPERYASGIKFFVKDYLGNVRITHRPFVLFDSLTQTYELKDSLVSAVDYFPFGKVLRAWYGEGQERWLSTAHERDAASGLDYRGARYYDADYGRFLSLDPLAGLFPSWSPYNYVFDNPIAFVDPTGRNPEGGDNEGGGGNEVPDDYAAIYHLPTVTITAYAPGYKKKPNNWDEKHGSYLHLAGAINKFGSGRTFRHDPRSREIHGTGSGLATVHLSSEEWEQFADLIGTSEIPVVSTAGDLSAAGLATSRGDLTGAGLSLGGAIPGVGLLFNGSKWIRRGGKWVRMGTETTRKFWTSTIVFNGVKVFQRGDIFDPKLISTWRQRGKTITGTNVDRMASGRAPIGVDGNPVNLHHVIQNETGGIAEMTQTFHKSNHGTIHINPSTTPSGINRGSFGTWRSNYWKSRANDF